MNKMYPCSLYFKKPIYSCPYCANAPIQTLDFSDQYTPYYDAMEESTYIKLRDYGPKPFVVNIEEATKQNSTFRTALWTGEHLQLTLMSIEVGEEIGLEIHPDLDQFIRIEEGQGLVKMGDRKDRLDFRAKVYDNFAFIIPAGKWHNLINTGKGPIKLYSIYAPPQHPKGTVHKTKADAEAAEEGRGYNKDKQGTTRQTMEFTLSELAQFDGTNGKPAYVAINGIVYDVSNNSKWSGGTHHGLTAGRDLSSQFEGCHGVSNKLDKLPKVGVLKG